MRPVCPQCVEDGTAVENPVDEILTQTRTIEAEPLASWIDGRGETETIEEIVGWRVLPCGHEYPVEEWVVLIDEAGVRLHPRRRVMLIADDGEVTPA